MPPYRRSFLPPIVKLRATQWGNNVGMKRGDRQKRLSLRVPDPTQRRYKKGRRYDDTRNGADGKTMSEQIGWLTGQFGWVWQRAVSELLTSIHWKHATKLKHGLCRYYFLLLLRFDQPQGPSYKLPKKKKCCSPDQNLSLIP